MANINVLDRNTINQIAAGEVVERPSSVVKELTENAIDAGASAVTVEIKDGGILLIRVSDNGTGIEKDEIKTAFLRHSTSKIKTAEDLLTIGSLGFRGEALSSISSVAIVEIVTKTRSSFNGTRYVIDGGEEKEFTDVGCPEGTTFIVRDLFYNTPARRKFLKSPMTEAGYVSDLMERMAISNPNISFKYINNNKTILHTSGNGNLKDIIYHIYGRDITNNLLEADDEINGIRITGYIGKPAVSRGNRNYENYFINGRYIKSNIITKAIEEAYKPYSMQHKYPFTILSIEIDSTLIDVNVHPAKLEIRFAEGEDMYRTVYTAVKNALAGKNMIPNVTIGRAEKEQKRTYDNIPEPFETERLKKYLGQDEIKEKNKSERENEINEMNRSLFMEDSLMLKDIPFIKKEDVKKQDIEKENAVKENNENNDSIKGNIENRDSIKEEHEVSNNNGSEISNTEHETSNKNNSIYSNTEYEAANKNSFIFSNIEHKAAVHEAALNEISLHEPELSYGGGEKANDRNIDSIIDNQLLPLSCYRIIGQLFSTYWLAEYDNQLYIIDQHAAHEKMIYEEMLDRLRKKNTPSSDEYFSQLVSPPIIITLSQREAEALENNREFLENLGFTIEYFGGKEYAVSSIPADMYNIDGKELIISFIDDLVEDASILTSELIIEKAASMSCKAAIKGNHVMSHIEAEAMLNRLSGLSNPFHCPHGRPVIIAMSKNEIEKKFKRIV